jgi:serine/threonine-protein kinase RsbW
MIQQSNLDCSQALNTANGPLKASQIFTLTDSVQGSDTIMLEIPADLQHVPILGAAVCALLANVEQLAERETTLYNLELVIQEVAVNIATHAYVNTGGRIWMTATLSHQPLCIIIMLRDTGISFEPGDVPQPRLGELQEHGYGLFLVNQLMDEVEYQQAAAENTWKLVKNLSVVECT